MNGSFNVMFKVSKAEANEFKVIKRREMISEISDLIKVSNWQNIVNTDKICNLTNNEISTLELEALSLGTDFKLENSLLTIFHF